MDQGNERHWIYAVNPGSEHYFLEDPETKSWKKGVDADALLEVIRHHPDFVHTWSLSTNFRWVERGDWVWAYEARRRMEIIARGTVVNDVFEDSSGGWHAELRWDTAMSEALARNPIPFSGFRQTVRRSPQLANERTVDVLRAWMRAHPGTDTSR